MRFILAMDRSPGFGSAACDNFAHFGLAFAAAPRLRRLTRHTQATRRLIMQKARRQLDRNRSPGFTSDRL
jgi:hypothetical protein